MHVGYNVLRVVKVCNHPDVSRLNNYCFAGCKSLSSVRISESASRISSRAFKDCANLKDINFEGTEEQWNKVKIERGNKPLKKARKHFGK